MDRDTLEAAELKLFNEWSGSKGDLDYTSWLMRAVIDARALAQQAGDGWIPVSERLPVDGVDVLLYHNLGDVERPEVPHAIDVASCFRGEWVLPWDRGRNPSPRWPQYWRPLPAQPNMAAGSGEYDPADTMKWDIGGPERCQSAVPTNAAAGAAPLTLPERPVPRKVIDDEPFPLGVLAVQWYYAVHIDDYDALRDFAERAAAEWKSWRILATKANNRAEAIEAELREKEVQLAAVKALFPQLRQAALIDDWHTFDEILEASARSGKEGT